uniref:Nedd4 family interacting protein 1 n=1 Tax=Nothobranchius furzeri TaxID=105023 RepID=A0A1A8AN25_NOTFU
MAETNARYQQLPNEEDPEEGPQAAADAPPPYSSITVDSSAYFDNKEDGVFPKPPSYNVATTLPSYDEAERTKAETSSPLVTGRQPQHREHLETFDDVIRSSLEDEDFVTRDDFEDADQLRIGNDGIFMLTFFMAFLFNRSFPYSSFLAH